MGNKPGPISQDLRMPREKGFEDVKQKPYSASGPNQSRLGHDSTLGRNNGKGTGYSNLGVGNQRIQMTNQKPVTSLDSCPDEER